MPDQLWRITDIALLSKATMLNSYFLSQNDCFNCSCKHYQERTIVVISVILSKERKSQDLQETAQANILLTEKKKRKWKLKGEGRDLLARI